MSMIKKGLLLAAIVFLSACSAFFVNNYRTGSSSSLVDFLYPKGEIPPEADEHIPVIRIPTRVGLAFVPSRGGMHISEAEQTMLLEQVRSAFSNKEYIERIEVIPSTYLSSNNGFDGLEQLGRLYGVDIMALVSHDQVLATNDTASSILYWTIVGAYVIKGTENEATTFVDTAVFDLDSHRMLFRAPGIHEASERSTALDSGQTSQELSSAGFHSAMEQMVINLDAELERFQVRIKQDQSVKIVSRSDPGGKGAIDGFLILLICLGLFQAGRTIHR